MRNIVITGGAGFIGHHLTNTLLNKNCKVNILDNLSNSNENIVTQLKRNSQSNKNLVFMMEDIRDIRAISGIFKRQQIDICIHLAAKIDFRNPLSDPLETRDVNIKGTLNMLELCSNYNVQNFIFASSAAVYGNSTILPVSEAQELEPISTYGASKAAGEALVSSYRSKIKNCVCLRFFNVYGKGQISQYAGVITRFVKRLSDQLPPIIYGDGNQTRDFISIDDVVRAIILSMNKSIVETSGGNIFNIGTGTPTRILDLARTMIDLYGLKNIVRPLHFDPVEGDIKHSCANIGKAKTFLKFVPKYDLHTGLTKSLGFRKAPKDNNNT